VRVSRTGAVVDSAEAVKGATLSSDPQDLSLVERLLGNQRSCMREVRHRVGDLRHAVMARQLTLG
jgi:hypothetical protein